MHGNFKSEKGTSGCNEKSKSLIRWKKTKRRLLCKTRIKDKGPLAPVKTI